MIGTVMTLMIFSAVCADMMLTLRLAAARSDATPNSAGPGS
jgi:hypothetical protein